jgi:Zn-dependent peptidase ImmA (M78 family)
MVKPNYTQSEQTASALLEKYKIDSPFVDVFMIAKREGIEIKFVSFSGEYDRVAGFFDPETMTIFVNKNEPTNRQTFTVAHELGHYLLQHTPDQYGVLMRWPLPNQEKTCIEKEADVFAANLLVPRHMLVKAMKQYSLTEDHADILAKMFGVSREMMTYRLKWLKTNR